MTTAWQWSMLRTGCPNPQVQHLQRKMATPMHATCAPRGRGLAPPHAPCPGRAPWCSLPANCGPSCRALLFFVVRPKRTKTAWTATDMAPSCVPKHPGRKTAWTATDKAPSRVSRRTKAAKNASDIAPSCGPMRKHKDSVDRHVLGAVAIWAQVPPATIEMQYKGQKKHKVGRKRQRRHKARHAGSQTPTSEPYSSAWTPVIGVSCHIHTHRSGGHA